jgi:hypothetical protein
MAMIGKVIAIRREIVDGKSAFDAVDGSSTGTEVPAPAASTRNAPVRSTRSPALSIGSLPRRRISYAGLMFSNVNSGLANGYLKRNNIDPTVGLRAAEHRDELAAFHSVTSWQAGRGMEAGAPPTGVRIH